MSEGEVDRGQKVAKVALKRLDAAELVLADDELRGCAFFRHADPERLRALLSQATARRYPDRTGVYAAGQPADRLFLVLRGEVRLTSGQGASALDLGTARRADVFGEGELLRRAPVREHSAHAFGDTELIELPAPMVGELRTTAPKLWEHLQTLDASRSRAGSELAEFLDRW